jgi:hypothetical protein
MSFSCEICQYVSKTKTNLNIHFKSAKHIKKCAECVGAPEKVVEATLEVETHKTEVNNEPVKINKINTINSNEINKLINEDIKKLTEELRIKEVQHKYELMLKDQQIQFEKEKFQMAIQYEKEKQELIMKFVQQQPVEKVIKTVVEQVVVEPPKAAEVVQEAKAEQVFEKQVFENQVFEKQVFENVEEKVIEQEWKDAEGPSIPVPTAEERKKAREERIKKAAEDKAKKAVVDEPIKDQKIGKSTHYRNLKEFTKHIPVVDNWNKWKFKAFEAITDLNVEAIVSGRTQIIPFIKRELKKSYDCFGKHEKPFYCEDKTHNAVWVVSDDGDQWTKMNADVLICDVFMPFSYKISSKAEELGFVKKYTKDMIIDLYLEHNPVYEDFQEIDADGVAHIKHRKKERSELTKDELPGMNKLDYFERSNNTRTGDHIKNQEYKRVQLPKELEDDYDQIMKREEEMIKIFQDIGFIEKEELY